MEKDYVYIDIFSDSTGLFTDSFCDGVGIATVEIEREKMFEYFKENVEEDFKDDDEIDGELDDEALFDLWVHEYYTCDDVHDLYAWCLKRKIEVLIDGFK